MEKILLDTDIGSDIDDALALAYLLSRDDCDLCGVTTVSGEATKRAEMVSAICRHAGRDIPIYVGEEKPLFIQTVQKEAQQASALGEWERAREFPRESGVEFMRRIILKYPNEITLLAIGPLTNVALLFTKYPEVQRLLRRVVIMGGFFADGAGAEWNIKCDPHAAATLFKSSAEVTAIGLDVTMLTYLTRDEAEDKFDGIRILEPVKDFLRVWFEKSDKVIFHDPLAAACVFKSDICEYKKGNVSVLLDENRLGSTVFSPDENGSHKIAVAVDKDRFFADWFGAVRNEK